MATFVNKCFLLMKSDRNLWISKYINYSSLQNYNWHRHGTIPQWLLPFILRLVFGCVILLERKMHLESVQGKTNSFLGSLCFKTQAHVGYQKSSFSTSFNIKVMIILLISIFGLQISKKTHCPRWHFYQHFWGI